MIVLDTHVLVWWIAGDTLLSARARNAIAKEQKQGGAVLISAISAWEMAMLIERGRLVLAVDLEEWLLAVQGLECVRFVPITTDLAVQSVRLPGALHKDPADRMIVALARQMNASLLTADTKIQAYSHVHCLW